MKLRSDRSAVDVFADNLRNLLNTYGPWQAADDRKLAELLGLIQNRHGNDKVLVFTKVGSSVQSPGSRIRIPDPVLKPDFEVELAVVIGKFAGNVTEQDALGYVAGYTVLHDMSAREFQFDVSPPQTSFAKSFDGATPMGPWIVTADEIPDPQRLALRCEINGEVLQEDTTAGMIFSVAFLVSYLSRFTTLEPGDVIATGTPAGVGAFRDPPRWLKSGDHLRMIVDGIGTLEHWIA